MDTGILYSFVSFSAPEATVPSLISMARRYGYDGVELRLNAKHGHRVELDTPPVDRARARRVAEVAGVPIACIGSACRLADPETSSDQTEQAHRAIDLAADVGSRLVRVFGGPVADGVGRERATRTLAAALTAIAPHAAERGVTIVLETHDDWSNPHDLVPVMGEVDHPAVGVLWDIMHPVLVGGSTVGEAFEVLRPWIRHVYAHDGHRVDGRVQFAPIGSDSIDHETAMHLLVRSGYKGYISGQWIRWEPADIHLPRELSTLRLYENMARHPGIK